MNDATLADNHSPKVGIADLHRAFHDGTKLVMVTAYDLSSAHAADRAGVDMILVGDSAAMVVFAHESTNAVGMDEMVLLTGAVTRAARRPFVVADMPFMSYQPADAMAVQNAGRLIAEGGADAVKLEGGGRMIERVRAISESGIAVFGHLGLTPQSAARLGGFRAQARTRRQAIQLLEDAIALEDAGAVAVVLEAIPSPVSDAVTQRLNIPTIGIGAGAGTSGQVLVYHDLVGFTDGPLPRFVRRYGDLAAQSRRAIWQYAQDVRGGAFPSAEHTYAMTDEERTAFVELLGDRRQDATKL